MITGILTYRNKKISMLGLIIGVILPLVITLYSFNMIYQQVLDVESGTNNTIRLDQGGWEFMIGTGIAFLGVICIVSNRLYRIYKRDLKK
ncbi:MAG: hypothetical protein ACXADY_07815 [Candidatus Hodarchaeales archaeon]